MSWASVRPRQFLQRGVGADLPRWLKLRKFRERLDRLCPEHGCVTRDRKFVRAPEPRNPAVQRRDELAKFSRQTTAFYLHRWSPP
jgi:hypothetical protein